MVQPKLGGGGGGQRMGSHPEINPGVFVFIFSNSAVVDQAGQSNLVQTVGCKLTCTQKA